MVFFRCKKIAKEEGSKEEHPTSEDMKPHIMTDTRPGRTMDEPIIISNLNHIS